MARETFRIGAWNSVPVNDRRQCAECGRLFDMGNEDDANEWAYGHDCEGE